MRSDGQSLYSPSWETVVPGTFKCGCTPSKCDGLTPDARILQSAVVYNNHLFVYGGTGGSLGSKVSASLYSFDLKQGGGWHKIEQKSTSTLPPPGRSGATTNIVAHSTMLLFGGQGSAESSTREMLSDMYVVF